MYLLKFSFLNIFFLFLSFLAPNLSYAQYTFNTADQLPVAIPYAGPGACNTNPGPFSCVTIPVSGLPGGARLTNVATNLFFSRRGALIMEVRSPNGAIAFRPFSRPGATDATSCGSNIYLDETQKLTFQDGVAGDFWNNSNNPTPTGSYFPSQPLTGLPNNNLSSTFSGTTNGNWLVCFQSVSSYAKGIITAASLTFVVPTAANASIRGRVLTAGGSGIKGAVVSLVDTNSGQTINSATSSFGYYNFSDIPVGASYLIYVNSKRYQFENSPQIISLMDDISDMDFIATNVK